MIQNPRTKLWEADIRDRSVGRLHLSLRTKRKREADERYAALSAVVREGDPMLIEDLRKRRINIEAVTRVHLARRPFDELRGSRASWPTLGDAVKDYLTHTSQHPDRAASTYRNACHYLARVVAVLGAGTPVDLITTARVDELRAFIATLNLKEWSGAQHLVRLSALFNWLNRREGRLALEQRRPARVLHNPVDPDVIGKPGQGRTRFLSPEEAVRVLAATPDAMRFPVIMGLFAGLRVEEMLHLRPPPFDLDIENGVVIVQARDGWRPKTKKRREIALQSRLVPIVEHHLEVYASQYYMSPSPYAVWGAGPMSADTVGERLKRIITEAGLVYGIGDPVGVTYHTFRHTFASWMVMDGTDLFTVSRLMGHSSTKMVEVTYGHLAPDHKRRAVERVGADIPMAAILGEAT